MKEKQKKAQIILLFVGLLLFVSTYLLYPNLISKKSQKDFVKKELKIDESTEDKSTTFDNVEYQGLYDFDKPFKVHSDTAFILSEDPDIIYMKNMRVILHLSDDRTVEITSVKGRYNKNNYNCYFEEDVIATDGDTKITAQNLDLLATDNFVQIYNKVNLYSGTGQLNADKIDYDFETKHFKISMFGDKSVKMKVIR